MSDEEKLPLIRDISGIIAARKSKKKWIEQAGTGRDVWKGIDAQEYVDRERRSWVCAFRLKNINASPLTLRFLFIFLRKTKNIFSLVKDIFSKIDEGTDFKGVTSMLTLLEVLVKPIKEKKDDLVELYSQKFLEGVR